MGKKYLFYCLFLFSSIILYSQTWTEKEASGNLREVTIITGEDFSRLLKQYEATSRHPFGNDFIGNPYGGSIELRYIDALELGAGLPVIKGTRPRLNGYYCLLIKKKTVVGTFNMLAYGNTNTGRLEIEFNCYAGFIPGTNEYYKQRNLFWGWVEGE